jgi:hypothetical protein
MKINEINLILMMMYLIACHTFFQNIKGSEEYIDDLVVPFNSEMEFNINLHTIDPEDSILYNWYIEPNPDNSIILQKERHHIIIPSLQLLPQHNYVLSCELISRILQPHSNKSLSKVFYFILVYLERN